MDAFFHVLVYDRALELAVTYKVHVDTVLCHREKYLTSTKQNEDKPQFIQLAQQVGMPLERLVGRLAVWQSA